MARRKDSPQKAAMREMMRDYLKNNDISIKDGTDVNSIMRDMMSVLLEGALDEELDEELGYSKYDYRNKETDNSRNGHSSKTMHTSYGDMDVAIPRDRNGDYEPQLIKKYQNRIDDAFRHINYTQSSKNNILALVCFQKIGKVIHLVNCLYRPIKQFNSISMRCNSFLQGFMYSRVLRHSKEPILGS